jgi:hypothetical protein
MISLSTPNAPVTIQTANESHINFPPNSHTAHHPRQVEEQQQACSPNHRELALVDTTVGRFRL